MKLKIGNHITTISIQGNNITGNVSAILENTIILFSGVTNHVVSKKDLENQGYKFTKLVKRPRSIAFSTNKKFKE